MSILNQIVEVKKQEVIQRSLLLPKSQILTSERMLRKPIPVAANLSRPNHINVIAEFKRKSPSKGFINMNADAAQIPLAYQEAGATAISVLTDEQFFGGSSADLQTARVHCSIPLLRKEFIVNEYQIYEAKFLGADFILLIAEVLTKEEIIRFSSLAQDLGLQTLLEMHDWDQIDKIAPAVHMVGINNRNLKSFEVDIHRSAKLLASIPSDKVKVAESGIDSVESLLTLKKLGFDAFLIGEAFMKQANPEQELKRWIEKAQATL